VTLRKSAQNAIVVNNDRLTCGPRAVASFLSESMFSSLVSVDALSKTGMRES